MRTTPAFRGPTFLGRHRLLPAAILFSLPFVPPQARANDATATIGYASTAAGYVPPSFSGGWQRTLSDSVIYVIPFRFDSLGDYSLTSVSFLSVADSYGGDPDTSGKNDQVGPPPDGDSGGGGSGSVLYPHPNQVSIQVFSSLPTSLDLPTALLSVPYSLSSDLTGEKVHTFTPQSTFAPHDPGLSPTLAVGTTYYLTFYKPGNSAASVVWSGVPGTPVDGDLDPVTGLYDDATRIRYYTITADGVTEHYDVIGGFAITATAVAVPEPATTAAILGGGVLAAALWMRRKRKYSAVIQDAFPPQR